MGIRAFYFTQYHEGDYDTPILSTNTNNRGFYELPLETDTEYCVCDDVARSCAKVSVAEDELLRLDYSVNQEGGRWAQEHARCD
ncbi:hypothetical protein [Gilvimarinus agarilyticus]|uniref:hypothetical protein n=1 Tax=Gilvimarinus agarilyticus TaxID=679259 RepID=UPI0005A1F1DC|nr:hypothetical protein [Gilvimarinus agarilyticus]